MQPLQLATLMRASLALALLLAAAASADFADACACGKMFDPVCGSDGRTYANPCTLRCTRDSEGRELAEVHAGLCEDQGSLVQARAVEVSAQPSRGPCVCPQIYLPVCGTDDRTYSNPCVLNCVRVRGVSSKGEDLAVAHRGSCLKDLVVKSKPVARPCICTRIFHPVCGNDGRTYASDCNLRCARSSGTSVKGQDLAVAHTGRCVDVKRKRSDDDLDLDSCNCDRVLMPVCGTDNQTYDNPCLLQCASATKGGDLRVAHEGEC